MKLFLECCAGALGLAEVGAIWAFMWWMENDGRPPYWLCCGWWSPWCLVDLFNDAVLARVGLHSRWVCDRHDRIIRGEEL